MTAIAKGDVTPRIPRRHRRDLLFHLVAQQFRARYRRNRLGWSWAIIRPALQLVVYVFVFSELHEFGRTDHYPMHLFIGITVMSLFQQGVTQATMGPVNRPDLVTLPGFDRRLIPVVTLLVAVVDYLFTVPVLLIFGFVTIGVYWQSVFLIFPMIVTVLLILGIGYILSVPNVFVRDIGAALPTVLVLSFFATPTFWTEDSIPEKYSWVVDYNPMAGILEAYRAVLIRGEPLPFERLLPATIVVYVTIAIGLLMYRSFSSNMADEL